MADDDLQIGGFSIAHLFRHPDGPRVFIRSGIIVIQERAPAKARRRASIGKRRCVFCRKVYYPAKFGITCSMRCSLAYSQQTNRGHLPRPQLSLPRIQTNPNPKLRAGGQTAAVLAVKRRAFCEDSVSAKYLGCSEEEFFGRFESLFTDGMTWENHGSNGWHVGHIIPCALFDLTLEEHKLVCFSWLNLRPEWKSDNLKRGPCLSQDDISSLHPDLKAMALMAGIDLYPRRASRRS